MKIEIWSDVVCPWCYVGKRRLERALAGFEHADDVEVVYRSFELDPTAPQHGHELTTPVVARKYGITEAAMRERQQQLIDAAAEDGLTLRLHENVHTRTVDAHRLLHLALEAGGPASQRALKEALLAAYFTDARDVGDHAVLRQVALDAGLDAARVDEVLAGDGYAVAVAADVAKARAYGAQGVPFFVVDEKFGVSGAQPVDVFSQLLDQAWTAGHPVLQTIGADDTSVCGPDGCDL